MLNRRFGGRKEVTIELDGRQVVVTPLPSSSTPSASSMEGQYRVKIGEWETTLTTSSSSTTSTSSPSSQSSAIPSSLPLEHTAQFPHTRQTSTIIPFAQKLHLFTATTHHILTLPSITTESESKTTSQDILKSPMPATVIEVRVKPGEEVKEGQVVVVLESMKMEISIRAGRDGVVGKVGVEKGDVVEEGGLLVALSPEEGEGKEDS